MASSFQLPPEYLKRLEYLANRLGMPEIQVITEAIDELYEKHSTFPEGTMLDRLVEGNFKPLDMRLDFDACSADAQREAILVKIRKAHRRTAP